MDRQTLTTAAALREAARELESQAEFNMTLVDRWSPARQAANNRLINQSRELHARADVAERPSEMDDLRAALRCTPPGFTLADMEG